MKFQTLKRERFTGKRILSDQYRILALCSYKMLYKSLPLIYKKYWQIKYMPLPSHHCCIVCRCPCALWKLIVGVSNAPMKSRPSLKKVDCCSTSPGSCRSTVSTHRIPLTGRTSRLLPKITPLPHSHPRRLLEII